MNFAHVCPVVRERVVEFFQPGFFPLKNMSSEEEHYYDNVDEIEGYQPENEEVSPVENRNDFDDKSPGLNVTDDGEDSQNSERVSTR